MTDRPEIVLRLTRTLARLAPRQPLPLRLCHAVLEVAEGRDSAIALGLTTHGRSVLCATSPAAARFEDAQDLVGQGPSLEALRSGRYVGCLDLSEHRARWPQLVDATVDLGLGKVQALPIRPGPVTIGVLTVHHEVGHRDTLEPTDLQFLADAVGAAILGELPDLHTSSSLWTHRDRVSQATGMVVAQLGVGPEDAVAVLRAHAFAQETTLAEISALVVARELDFGAPDGEGSS